jgi:hypothetical protein
MKLPWMESPHEKNIVLDCRYQRRSARFLPSGSLTKRLQQWQPPRQAAASKSTTF